MATSPGDFTRALAAARAGDGRALDALMPVMYEELRAVAGSFFARQPAGHLLQPTVVVHEAYLKLFAGNTLEWQSRAHFLAVAARAMRQILADHARSQKSRKRGGAWQRITLSGLEGPDEAGRHIDLAALDDVLARLAARDAEQARVVELRFLAGLDVEETACVLGISPRTVCRHWFGARAWLRRELADETDE